MSLAQPVFGRFFKERLIANSVNVETFSPLHWRAHFAKSVVDLWPTTGKWKDQKNGATGMGVVSLRTHLGIEQLVTENEVLSPSSVSRQRKYVKSLTSKTRLERMLESASLQSTSLIKGLELLVEEIDGIDELLESASELRSRIYDLKLNPVVRQ